MTAQPIPSLHFDSSTLPPEQQFPAQQKFMASFSITTPNAEQGFFSRASAWAMDNIIVNLSRLGPIGIERDLARIRSDSVDHYVAAVMLEGTVWEGSFDGPEVRVDPGEIVMIDMSRPMRSRAEPGTTITVLIPRQVLDGARPSYDVHGLVLDAPAGRLLTDYLVALVARLPSLSVDDAPGVARGTRDLLAATLATARLRAPDPSSTGVLLRAKRYIAAHLGDDLSAATLAAALGVSRSTLFRTFEHMGGLEGFVRARRLARAHELLTQADAPRAVAQVAFAVGFKSGAHFSRAFRDSYGYTAGDLQAGRTQRHPLPGGDSDIHRTYANWSQTLR